MKKVGGCLSNISTVDIFFINFETKLKKLDIFENVNFIKLKLNIYDFFGQNLCKNTNVDKRHSPNLNNIELQFNMK